MKTKPKEVGNMKLIDFIEKQSTGKLAKKLNVQASRVSNWRVGRCLPDDKLKMAIVKLSKGKVSYKNIIEDFYNEKA
jgi:DNA-binding transcriptional regulator YiaG